MKDSNDTEKLFSILFDDDSAKEKGSLYSRVGFDSKFFIHLAGNLSSVDISYAHVKVNYSFSYK